MSRLPLPLTEHDRTAGYWWELRCGRSRCPAPWSSTHPAGPAAFFEALVADNLDIGRPDTVELFFAGPRSAGGAELGCTPRTSLITRGTDVTVNASFKHSRVKQYLKDGRALRDRDRRQHAR